MFYDSIFLKEENEKLITMRPVIWKSKGLIVIPKGFKVTPLKIPKWIWWEIRAALALREYIEKDKDLSRQCRDRIFKEAVGNISAWKKYLIWRELKLLPSFFIVPYVEQKLRRICHETFGRRIVFGQLIITLLILSF